MCYIRLYTTEQGDKYVEKFFGNAYNSDYTLPKDQKTECDYDSASEITKATLEVILEQEQSGISVIEIDPSSEKRYNISFDDIVETIVQQLLKVQEEEEYKTKCSHKTFVTAVKSAILNNYVGFEVFNNLIV